MRVLLMVLGLAQAPGLFTTTLTLEELQEKQAVIETTAGTIVLDLLADAASGAVAR